MQVPLKIIFLGILERNMQTPLNTNKIRLRLHVKINEHVIINHCKKKDKGLVSNATDSWERLATFKLR